MSVLEKLRSDTVVKKDVVLLLNKEETTEDITKATELKLSSGEILDLDTKTEFVIDGEPITLRVAVYSWINRDLSSTAFLEDSTKKQIQTLSFIQRNDLIGWLNGTTKESQFISSDKEAKSGEESIKSEAGNEPAKEEDSFLKSVLAHERALVDSNTALRGNKSIDFSNVARECEIKIVKQLKRKSSKQEPSGGKDALNGHKKRRQNPIILISPAASALLSIKNIKPFLQDGKFYETSSTQPEALELFNDESDIRNIKHEFSKIGPVTFLVVNNTDKFTKPEYWDRVVAVFTTGQEWQFKNYKWNTPNQLFQKVRGFYFYYSGDMVPAKVQEWNVEKIALERTKRFKDAQVLNHFWDSIERALVAKGYN